MLDQAQHNALRTFTTLENAGESAEASGRWEQAAEYYEAAALIHREIAGADPLTSDRLIRKAGILRDQISPAANRA